MDAAEHYAEAERLLDDGFRIDSGRPAHMANLAAAQVHATMSVAASLLAQAQR